MRAHEQAIRQKPCLARRDDSTWRNYHVSSHAVVFCHALGDRRARSGLLLVFVRVYDPCREGLVQRRRPVGTCSRPPLAAHLGSRMSSSGRALTYWSTSSANEVLTPYQRPSVST